MPLSENPKKPITLNPKRRKQKFASMRNDHHSVLPGTTEEPRYVRFYPELEMQHLLFIIEFMTTRDVA